MPKHSSASSNGAARTSSSASAAAHAASLGRADDPQATTTAKPIFLRSHPYLRPPSPAATAGQPPTSVRANDRYRLKANQALLGRMLLRPAGTDAGDPLAPWVPADHTVHEAPFKAFVAEVPDLESSVQIVAYNMTHGVHIDYRCGDFWHSQAQAYALAQREKARRPGQTWEQLGATLSMPHDVFQALDATAQQRAVFFALREVIGTPLDARIKLKELFGIDISFDTAEDWAALYRGGLYRARRRIDEHVARSPELKSLTEIRVRAKVKPENMSDREIEQYVKELERRHLLEEALALDGAGQCYLAGKPQQRLAPTTFNVGPVPVPVLEVPAPPRASSALVQTATQPSPSGASTASAAVNPPISTIKPVLLPVAPEPLQAAASSNPHDTVDFVLLSDLPPLPNAPSLQEPADAQPLWELLPDWVQDPYLPPLHDAPSDLDLPDWLTDFFG